MRKFTLKDQLYLTALLVESTALYLVLHYYFNLDIVGSLLAISSNSALQVCLYLNLMVKGYIKNQSKQNPEHLIIYNEKKEREDKMIDAVFNYTIHYIGKYLTHEQRTVLRHNIIVFSFDLEEELVPVVQEKFDGLNIYDITHLCHAIGNHTVCKKNIHQIALFTKACFPAYTGGQHEHSIAAKLTNTDRPTLIPVIRRTDPLPDFNVM